MYCLSMRLNEYQLTSGITPSFNRKNTVLLGVEIIEVNDKKICPFVGAGTPYHVHTVPRQELNWFLRLICHATYFG